MLRNFPIGEMMFGNLEGIQEMSETLRIIFNDVFSQWAGASRNKIVGVKKQLNLTFMTFWCNFFMLQNKSGQIIATSHHL